MEANLLTKIAYGNVNLEEIMKAKVDEVNRIILLAAYYELHNKKQGIIVLKEAKRNTTDPIAIKKYNGLIQRLQTSRAQIFDKSFYTKLLGVELNNTLKVQLIKEEEKKNKKEPVTLVKVQDFSDVKFKKNFPDKNKNVPNKYNETPNKYKEISNTYKELSSKYKPEVKCDIEPKKENIEVKKEQLNTKLLIKDLFAREVEKIGAQIYAQMGKCGDPKKAAQAWDSFEVLINSPVTDKRSLEHMISLIEKLSDSLNLSTDEKKYIKYLDR